MTSVLKSKTIKNMLNKLWLKYTLSKNKPTAFKTIESAESNRYQ